MDPDFENLSKEVAGSRNARKEHEIALRYAVARVDRLAKRPLHPEEQKRYASETIRGIQTIVVMKIQYGG